MTTTATTLTISSPSTPVAPGSTVVAHGKTPDCATTTHSATVDGTALQTTWDCTNGRFSITVKAPQCSATGTNIIIFTVEQGDDHATSSTPIDCDDDCDR